MQASFCACWTARRISASAARKKIHADTRIVAATNLVLDEAVQSGRFRRDLFHRLDVLQLRVPPLRERVEAIVRLSRRTSWRARASPLSPRRSGCDGRLLLAR